MQPCLKCPHAPKLMPPMLPCSYDFQWEPTAALGVTPFRCATRKGTIGPGRQFEMVFEYTPQADVLAEAFWVRGCGFL